MKIPAELLETLAVVVKDGTFDAAARTLHVTPSAVSQRIKALELRVGRVLVVRSKPVRVTSDLGSSTHSSRAKPSESWARSVTTRDRRL